MTPDERIAKLEGDVAKVQEELVTVTEMIHKIMEMYRDDWKKRAEDRTEEAAMLEERVRQQEAIKKNPR
jgi:hypothetical protein